MRIRLAVKGFMLLIMYLLVTCGSSTADSVRENNILDQVTDEKKEKYADLLVDITQYTTKGSVYQNKYHRHLIGIAGDIIEKGKISIVRGTIGFYYDKKAGDRNKLYLGLDVHSKQNYPNLTKDALNVFKKDIRKVIHTLNSCRSIFEEDEITGMVVGWKWFRDGQDDHISIWIEKGDVAKYESRQLTLDEVILRSTITSSSGKIIRLP